jgi:hypothetical protein
MENVYTSDGVPGRYWHALADGRIQCDLCPRECKLHEGQRGLCFVRGRTGDEMVLTTYGRSSGFCLDPIEKKPLNHFLPGTAVLSFGTAGCNLTWLEITTLLIPGKNDSSHEVGALCEWVATRLGPDVPLHLTAFHPDWKMRDAPPTPPSTLKRARETALRTGLRYVYTGNVHDEAGQSTYCDGCGARLIGRDWYTITAWGLDLGGHCAACGEICPGLFDALPGSWGARREPVVIAAA